MAGAQGTLSELRFFQLQSGTLGGNEAREYPEGHLEIMRCTQEQLLVGSGQSAVKYILSSGNWGRGLDNPFVA